MLRRGSPQEWSRMATRMVGCRRNSGESSKSERVRFPWAASAASMVLGGVAIVYYNMEWERVKPPQARQIEVIGEALIGGPFSLVDMQGRPVTSASFRGKFVLLYFGFTYCPDICPAELFKMERIRDRLESLYGYSKDDVVPAFVTVDPWRDSVAKVRAYLGDYHPDFVGLTGTPDQIKDLARRFRVYSENTTQKAVVYGDEDDYLVDHSVFKYLLLPDGSGRCAEWYGSDLSDDEVARRMAEKMREYGHLGNPSFWNSTKDLWNTLRSRLQF